MTDAFLHGVHHLVCRRTCSIMLPDTWRCASRHAQDPMGEKEDNLDELCG